MAEIRVCGVAEEEDPEGGMFVTLSVPNSGAMYFSVLLHEDEQFWLADFADLDDALEYAHAVGAVEDLPVNDLTYDTEGVLH
jgi:hypothetical protein